ncbi:urate hydroxylase PuuD [Betaproteobacteria bacterium]|nr:urate hydroxylase PuuD [Betaproteobacteria bacterium]
MGSILSSLSKTVIAGFVLLGVIVAIFGNVNFLEPAWLAFVFRWLHVMVGVMWIGLLWYFNFVQIPSMPKISDEHKPAISKVIAPEALFWFRYSALLTVITGLIVAWLNGYGHDALMLGEGYQAIGIGMWLAIIMAINVWFIIWPNQKRALGIVDAEPEVKAKSAKLAMLTSRTNTLLSVPMLYLMVAQQNVGLG